MKDVDTERALENLKFATVEKNVMERHNADKIVKYISKLQEQVERLKCCGNCGLREISKVNCSLCWRCKYAGDFNKSGKKEDNWQPIEGNNNE